MTDRLFLTDGGVHKYQNEKIDTHPLVTQQNFPNWGTKS